MPVSRGLRQAAGYVEAQRLNGKTRVTIKRVVADEPPPAEPPAPTRFFTVAKIQRAIGRVQIRHGRVQRFYTVALVPAPQLAVTWSRVDEAYAADDELPGCYYQGDDLHYTDYELKTLISLGNASFICSPSRLLRSMCCARTASI